MTITINGTSKPTVATVRPTGPNVVSVFAQRVIRMTRSGRGAEATGPAHVVDARPAGVGALTEAKH